MKHGSNPSLVSESSQRRKELTAAEAHANLHRTTTNDQLIVVFAALLVFAVSLLACAAILHSALTHAGH